MPTTRLLFSQPTASGKPYPLEIVLRGVVTLSPYLEVNDTSYALHASYTHSDGTVENMYYPILTAHDHHC